MNKDFIIVLKPFKDVLYVLGKRGQYPQELGLLTLKCPSLLKKKKKDENFTFTYKHHRLERFFKDIQNQLSKGYICLAVTIKY